MIHYIVSVKYYSGKKEKYGVWAHSKQHARLQVRAEASERIFHITAVEDPGGLLTPGGNPTMLMERYEW